MPTPPPTTPRRTSPARRPAASSVVSSPSASDGSTRQGGDGRQVPSTSPRRRRGSLRAGLAAAASVVAIVVLLGALPIVLWAWRHNPLPAQIEPGRWLQLLQDGYIHPDVIPNLLAIALWLVWAQFVVAVLREAAARALRGAAAPRLVLVAPPVQRLAAYLVAAVSLALSSAPVNAATPSLTALTTASATFSPASANHYGANPAGSNAAGMIQLTGVETAVPAGGHGPATGTVHVAGPYDTLRSLAAQHYADPDQWTRIRDASVGLTQPDGNQLAPGFVSISAGTRLHIPSPLPGHTGRAGEAPDRPRATGSGTTESLAPDRGTYPVRDGDTLWEIADEHYPDAAPRQLPDVVETIADTNRGVTDGRGHHLHDPDRINPGMHLTLPTIAAPPGTPAATESPAAPAHPAPAERQPAGSSPPSTAPAAPSVAQPAPPKTATDPTAGQPTDTSPEPTSPTISSPAGTAPSSRTPAGGLSTGSPGATAGADRTGMPEETAGRSGSGHADQADPSTVTDLAVPWVAGAGFLAAGFLALWRYRRRRRDGRVRPGQAVPPPDPTLIPLHTSLGIVDDQPGIARLQIALRHLAGLHTTDHALDIEAVPGSDPGQPPSRPASGSPAPTVQVVLRHADGDIEVYLREPIDTPVEPWQLTGHPRIWLLEADAPLTLPGHAVDLPHPNPALVQLGSTTDGGQLFIDLESVGVLGLADSPGPESDRPDAVLLDESGAPTAGPSSAGPDVEGPDAEVPANEPSAHTSLRGIARALAATLATTPWADLPVVHTSGFDPYGLADEERIHAHDALDDLIAQTQQAAAQIGDRLTRTGLDSTLDLRATHPQEPADPTIVIAVDRTLTPEQGRALTAAAGTGNRGVAVVVPAHTAGPTTWTLTHIPGPFGPPRDSGTDTSDIPSGTTGDDVSSRADQVAAPGGADSAANQDRWRLDPLGVLIKPVKLAAEELANLAALLAEASTPAIDIDLDALPAFDAASTSSPAEQYPSAQQPAATDPTAIPQLLDAGTEPLQLVEPGQGAGREPSTGGVRADNTATDDTATDGEPEVEHSRPSAAAQDQAGPDSAAIGGSSGGAVMPEPPEAGVTGATADRLAAAEPGDVASAGPTQQPGGPAASGPRSAPESAPPASAAAWQPRPWQVMVRLFGPVSIAAADGTPATDVRDRALETLAWLALHRGGTRASMESALWPTGARPATVSNTLSRARAALEQLAGPQAHTWIPSYAAELRLDAAVTTDLDQLQARLSYAARHRHRPELAIPVLRDGLALVRGVPAGYPWLDAELGSILTTIPTTAAQLLATMCLDNGDPDSALEATAIGLGVLPAHPGLFGLRMLARNAQGDRPAIRTEYHSYLRAEGADPLADGETDRDLQRLYRQLTHPQARQPGDQTSPPRHPPTAIAPRPRSD